MARYQSWECSSQCSDVPDDIDDTYDTKELQGKLFGKVKHLTNNYGFIQPNRRLPRTFKKRLVYFTLAKVEGLKVSANSLVCFKLNLKEHQRPNALWVKVQAKESQRRTKACAPSSAGRNGPWRGTVVMVSASYGFVKPDGPLPPPHKTVNIHFKVPPNTSVGRGHPAVFTLNKEYSEKPTVADIAFEDEDYNPDFEFPYKRHTCGHICFRDVDKPKEDVCHKVCGKRLGCGHACSGICSEKCPKECTSCFLKQEETKMYRLEDLDGLLTGTVVSVNQRFGLVKPTRKLPPPYNGKPNVYFPSSESTAECVDEGNNTIVFTLDKARTENPAVDEIAFANNDYDPTFEIPYKHPICGHICFQDKDEPDENVCLKACSKSLDCGHACSGICSDSCPKQCPSCHRKKKGNNMYKLSDLDGLLSGTVVSVSKISGLLKPTRKLPHPYNTKPDVSFPLSGFLVKPVHEGDTVVFTLNKAKTDNPTVADLAFSRKDYNTYVRSICGHICFQDKDAVGEIICRKICSKPLSCGHPCSRICSDMCPKECSSCVQEKKDKQTYQLSDLDGLLTGTVASINQVFGLVKPTCKLPPPYNAKPNVYFPSSESTAKSVTGGDTVVFTLNRQTTGGRPSVAEIAFAKIEFDPSSEIPYKRAVCGHICFKAKGNRSADICHKTCAKILSCGHTCPKKCSKKCQKMCTDCLHIRNKERETYSLLDLDGVLHGTIVTVNDLIGLVKPNRPLPPPYDALQTIHFMSSELTMRSVTGGDSVVFTIDRETGGRPSVAEIAFAKKDFEPSFEIAYKHSLCGHICFKARGVHSADICSKICSKILTCGHACPRKCPEKCLKMCPNCFEIKRNEIEAYSSSDIDGLLHGTVVTVNEHFGLVKPDRQLPPPYNPMPNIHFVSSPHTAECVGESHPVLFTLGKESAECPSVDEIIFTGMDYDPDIKVPYKRATCGHICYQDKGGRNLDICSKACAKSLSCGHSCPAKCSDVCKKECPSCFKKRKKEQESYKLSDLDGFLYGTVINVQERYGFVKPDRGLPPPYSSRKEIYFSADLIAMAEVSIGKKAVFKLNTSNKEKPAALKITVIKEDVNLSTMEPYIRPGCGHICFSINGEPDEFCFKVCQSLLPCGHYSGDFCYAVLPERCDECSEIQSMAKEMFSVPDCDVLMGVITYVKEGHGYIKLKSEMSQGINEKNGVFFSFDEGTSGEVQNGHSVVFTLRTANNGKRLVVQMGIIDKDAEEHVHIRKITQVIRPRKPTPDHQSNDINLVDKLEIHAANGKSDAMHYHTLRANREVDSADPKDINFRIAESHFLRLAQKAGKQYEIESVNYYINPALVRKFRAKSSEFEKLYGTDQQSKHVLAFHGTREDNISSIVRENFKLELCKRNVYGKGIYLSEFPNVSIDFGKSLLLCKVLPGKSLDVDNSQTDRPIRYGYDSHRVHADKQGYGWALVVKDPDQILPCYVINYKILNNQPSPSTSRFSTSASQSWQPPPRPKTPPSQSPTAQPWRPASPPLRLCHQPSTPSPTWHPPSPPNIIPKKEKETGCSVM